MISAVIVTVSLIVIGTILYGVFSEEIDRAVSRCIGTDDDPVPSWLDEKDGL